MNRTIKYDISSDIDGAKVIRSAVRYQTGCGIDLDSTLGLAVSAVTAYTIARDTKSNVGVFCINSTRIEQQSG